MLAVPLVCCFDSLNFFLLQVVRALYLAPLGGGRDAVRIEPVAIKAMTRADVAGLRSELLSYFIDFKTTSFVFPAQF